MEKSLSSIDIEQIHRRPIESQQISTDFCPIGLRIIEDKTSNNRRLWHADIEFGQDDMVVGDLRENVDARNIEIGDNQVEQMIFAGRLLHKLLETLRLTKSKQRSPLD